LPRRKLSGAALPAFAVALPLLAPAVRAGTTQAGTWFWGDQALIDLEARSTLTGHNLLGVYDRYGWHHLGPLWLAVLGVFRELGGGSTVALVLGNYLVQAAAAAAIVVVASRLRPGLTAWWVALVVLGYEWSFGIERLGTVWAPYAIALPAALLVLLVADIVASRDPWPATIAAAVCATFLCQTDISTGVVVAALVVATPVLRLLAGARFRWRAGGPATTGAARKPRATATTTTTTTAITGIPGRPRTAGGRWSMEPGWGWSAAKWRPYAAALVAVVVVLWLPPAIQQLSSRPGNLVQVYRFLSTHPGRQTWQSALQAGGTIFGSFPLRMGEQVAKHDADPHWLVAQSLWWRPWYLVYFLVTVVAVAWACVRHRRAAAALAAAAGIAMVAATWSVRLAYGPLYPYLVLWTGALVVPAWTAWWLAFVPPVKAAAAVARTAPAARAATAATAARAATAATAARGRPTGKGRPAEPLPRKGPARWYRRADLAGTNGRAGPVLPLVSIAVVVAVSSAFLFAPGPMAGAPSHLARRSWDAVAAAALAPGVKTVYVDIVNADSMPDAAAIADQAVRHGLRVEVNSAALYYLDPSFAPRARAQLKIVVCCARKQRGKPPAGTEFRGRVGGDGIYISTAGYVPPPARSPVVEAASPGRDQS
jgi:hypothetical protein